MTCPEPFIHLSIRDGNILYSVHLHCVYRCKMDLRKFPLDSQACPLEIGSFGFNSQEMIYRCVAQSYTHKIIGVRCLATTKYIYT